MIDMLSDLEKTKAQIADLQAELAEYLGILKVVPDIIYKIDPDGNFVYVSDAIKNLGYIPEELKGKHFSTIIHPDDLPSISREKILPRFAGKKTGDEAAPRLFDERRTGKRATKGLIIRMTPQDWRYSKSDQHQQAKNLVYALTMKCKSLSRKARRIFSISPTPSTVSPMSLPPSCGPLRDK
ncbi:MAG: PAS domain-containing protein [Chitinivibrionales bacterium]|nr:PAS domain-containing protein [Chitinivibrionales bacterium]